MLAYVPASNPLNASELIFPILECIHILGLAVLVGTIALVDFRVLGFGMRREPAAEIAKDLWMWTLLGLVAVLFSGPLLFSSDPDMYYLNSAFQIKMVLLALALIFHYTIHRKAVARNAPGAAGKLVACISLALWVGVVFGGIFIGFVETPS